MEPITFHRAPPLAEPPPPDVTALGIKLPAHDLPEDKPNVPWLGHDLAPKLTLHFKLMFN